MNATTPRRLAAVAVLLAVPALSACGVNFDAQTDKIYQPAEGVNNRDGEVDVLNALIVSDEAGVGRFVAGFVNETDTDDEITGITGVGVDQSTGVTLGEGDFIVPANGSLQLADEDGGMVAATGDRVVAGGFVRLGITFSDAAPVEVNVPVVSVGEDYGDIALPVAEAAPADEG